MKTLENEPTEMKPTDLSAENIPKISNPTLTN